MSMISRIILLGIIATMCGAGGCAARNPNAGLEATRADPELAKASYWWARPRIGVVRHDDFETLWRACRRAMADASYTIDRVDYREGVLTSLPLISKQAFEVWRSDVVTVGDIAESSLATIRRTVRWDVNKRDDGGFEAYPSVLVERYSFSERRLTSAMQYQEIFSDEHRVEGSRLRDRGVFEAEVYWYAIGRDRALERRLLSAVHSMVE